MNFKLEDLSKIQLLEYVKLSEELTCRIDNRIETAQNLFQDMDTVIPDLIGIVEEYLKTDSFSIISRGQNLKFRQWNEIPGIDCSQLLIHAEKNISEELPEITGVNIITLDVNSTIIGFILYTEKENISTRDKKFNSLFINKFAELVDNFIYSENSCRETHSLKIRIAEAMKNRIFSEGLIESVNVLKNFIDFNSLILIYHEEHDENLRTTKYFIYSDVLGIFDPYHYFDRDIHFYILDNAETILNSNDKYLLEKFSVQNYQEEFLISGIKNAVKIGKLIVSSGTSIFDVRENEMLQIFVSFIQQRVLDFNKEWRTLSQYFSLSHRIKLLESDNYENDYLTPRVKNVSILYADISSFTYFSEQVLKDPETITELFDIWATGVMAIIWEHGGCCDKFIGDCVIAHFGPPFFNEDSKTNALNAINCSVSIREFTNDLLKREEKCFRMIRESSSSHKFGIATGLNYGDVNIGIIGPNRDYTAFGSNMNNCARIQHKAECGEILIFRNMYDLLKTHCQFEGPFYTDLRNVKHEVEYYKLLKIG